MLGYQFVINKKYTCSIPIKDLLLTSWFWISFLFPSATCKNKDLPLSEIKMLEKKNIEHPDFNVHVVHKK